MNKKTHMLMICALIFAMACNKPHITATPEGPEKQPEAKTTAAEVIQAFKEAKLPVGKVLIFTDETDPNKLMNRPNSYIEKADWGDDRVKQTDPKYPIGGTIEIFKSDEDLQKRKAYIEGGPAAALGMNNEYMYIHKNALIRIRKDLTPAQAKDYEKALSAMQ